MFVLVFRSAHKKSMRFSIPLSLGEIPVDWYCQLNTKKGSDWFKTLDGPFWFQWSRWSCESLLLFQCFFFFELLCPLTAQSKVKRGSIHTDSFKVLNLVNFLVQTRNLQTVCGVEVEITSCFPQFTSVESEVHSTVRQSLSFFTDPLPSYTFTNKTEDTCSDIVNKLRFQCKLSCTYSLDWIVLDLRGPDQWCAAL